METQPQVGNHQHPHAHKADQHAHDFNPGQPFVAAEKVGQDDGKDRHGRLQQRGQPAGDRLLTPEDERIGQCPIEQAHHGVDGPQLSAARDGLAGDQEQHPQDRRAQDQPGRDQGQGRHLADGDFDEQVRRSPQCSQDQQPEEVQNSTHRPAGVSHGGSVHPPARAAG
jgi:hypothetical protein